jgi:hypothetical protein
VKTCTKCKLEKPLADFPIRSGPSAIASNRDGKPYSHCRQCFRQHSNKYGKSNRSKNVKKLVEFLKEHPCVDCAEKDYLVLQFDHVTGVKRANVSFIAKVYAWKHVEEEIKKCVVRCANCHTRKTAKERGWLKHAQQENEKKCQGLVFK